MKTKLIFLFLVLTVLISGCVQTVDETNELDGLPDTVGPPDIETEPNGLPGDIGTPGDVETEPDGLPGDIGEPPENI